MYKNCSQADFVAAYGETGSDIFKSSENFSAVQFPYTEEDDANTIFFISKLFIHSRIFTVPYMFELTYFSGASIEDLTPAQAARCTTVSISFSENILLSNSLLQISP